MLQEKYVLEILVFQEDTEIEKIVDTHKKKKKVGRGS